LDREKCSPDYNFVIFDEIFDLQSIDQVLDPTRATQRTRARKHSTGIEGELRNAVNARDINACDNSYRAGHGMIGTVLIAFAGEPLTILVLIAR
jgi:hypothetical protein